MDDRAWMYTGWKCGGQLSGEWIDKTEAFLDRAFAKLKGGKPSGVRATNVEASVDKHAKS